MSAGVSLVFPAFNRLEFTKQSWAALMANTDWSLVEEFHVYDDGSTDGTAEFLMNAVISEPPLNVPVFFRRTSFRSPMGVTLDWIRRSKAPLLAKLDNDTVYPPGWLNVALDVMERNPKLEMLGLECMRTPGTFMGIIDGHAKYHVPGHGQFDYERAQFVSGLGVYRRSAFAQSLPPDEGYFGFEEWQRRRCKKAGWIIPSLPVFLLDRLPMDPWKSLSESYVEKGWQRPWSGAGELRYKPEESDKWSWWRPVE